MKDFRQLKVWEKAHQLTLTVYRVTKALPPDERFGLTSQIRRAAASVPSNIAEGCGRNSDAELARFMEIAMGSASEVEYQILLARDLEYVATPEHEDIHGRVCEVKRMLASFIQKLRADR
ncbi:MAG: four helix bundle protein [Planctomycetes bacterium]|nr:four helix bundle protein [Planctomycetota bacterium]